MYSVMSALFGAALLTVSGFCSAFAAEVKIGFLGGITGPAASVVPAIRDGAHLALTQINRQGGILDSRNAVLVVRDTGCLGENKALSAAQSLVFEELVSGVIGAVCSAASLKVAENVTVPAGVTMISPASTTPQLTTLQDNDLVFRTLASDALEVEMLAEIAKENVGGGLLVAYPDDAFGGAMLAAFTQKLPGLTGSYAYAGQEEKKGTYRKQLAELAEEGGKSLAIIGYGGGAAKSVLRNAIRTKLFERFYVTPDAINGLELGGFGENLVVLQPAYAVAPGNFRFKRAAKSVGFDGTARFSANAYDAAFILALAIQRAGNSDPKGLSAHVRAVASAPGEVVLPGQWEKAVKLLGEGRDINYEGAAGLQEFDANGDVAKTFNMAIVNDGTLEVVRKVE